jgi:phage terminase small subunit
MNTSQQREFMMDPTHLDLERLCRQLISIDQYCIKVFCDEYEKVVKSYSIVMVSLSVLLIVAAVVTYFKWVMYHMNCMVYESNGIKALLRLILSVDPRTNNELRKALAEAQDEFKILV